MGNIRRLFVNDVKRITQNTVTRIIVLGLILLPSIFVWYNILACWDVFDNTDNLTVAVANTDEGYKSDLVPLKVNFGEQIVSNLRADDQLEWVFVTEEEAVDGVQSGRYYAAVVIPGSFSRDLMTFYSEEVEHATIVYYSNEKKNVVAPKLTDQGADRVSHKVNQVFAEELSEIALSTASALSNYAEDAGVDSRIGDLADHMETLGSQLTQASQTLEACAGILQASEQLVQGSSTLLSQAGASAADIESTADEGKQAVSSMGQAAASSIEALGEALESSAASLEGVAASIDDAYASVDDLAVDSAEHLRAQADAIDSQITATEDLITQLEALKEAVPADYQETLQAFIDHMKSQVETKRQLQAALRTAADDVEAGNAGAQETHEQAKQLAQQTSQSVSDLNAEYTGTIKPNLDELVSQMSSLSSSLSTSAGQLVSAGQSMAGSAGSVAAKMETSRQTLLSSSTELSATAQRLTDLAVSIRGALQSEDIESLRAILTSDTDALASILSAPVALDRIAVFPAEDFGSQMAPLYATLGLWIGSLLMVVGVRVTVSRAQRDELPDWKLHQLFLGRFGLFAVLSLLQSTVMALGNMLFLGVQCANPLLYLVCFWAAGLVFAFICYTLVISFANLGKAIGVLLLIIQVTSGGGSFPLQMLPDFFQVLSPFLPATHVINMMRAAMMGVYENDFFIELGCLLLFVAPFLLLGLALRKPLMSFLSWYVDKVEESKLIC